MQFSSPSGSSLSHQQGNVRMGKADEVSRWKMFHHVYEQEKT